MPLPQSLDHLILFLLIDATTHLPQIPSFLTQNFTLTPGGVHADGATSNTLILLADGCYIKLICFIDPVKAAEHWWSSSQLRGMERLVFDERLDTGGKL
jgi:hypothetical protein